MTDDYSLVFGSPKSLTANYNTQTNNIEDIENQKKKEKDKRDALNSYLTDDTDVAAVAEILSIIIHPKQNSNDENTTDETIQYRPAFTTNENKSCYAMSYENDNSVTTDNNTGFSPLLKNSASATSFNNGLTTDVNHSSTGFSRIFQNSGSNGDALITNGNTSSTGFSRMVETNQDASSGVSFSGDDSDDCDCDCDFLCCF